MTMADLTACYGAPPVPVPCDRLVYVGGAFSSVNASVPRLNLAQFDVASGRVGSTNPGVGSASFGGVRSLAMGANGLRVVGYYSTAGGKPASNF